MSTWLSEQWRRAQREALTVGRWVIVLGDSEPPLWWDGQGWSVDATVAQVFPTQIEAEAVREHRVKDEWARLENLAAGKTWPTQK